jgi:hypothetical protein
MNTWSRNLLVVGALLWVSVAFATGGQPLKAMSGTGSTRVSVTVPNAGANFTLQNNLGAASTPVFCEYGTTNSDGGSKNIFDAGQPLYATINGTGDYFSFPGDPVLIRLSPGVNQVACIAEDGGTKNVVVKPDNR